MTYFDCTASRIRNIISRSHVPEDPQHAENTLTWVRKLDPAADEAMQIVALRRSLGIVPGWIHPGMTVNKIVTLIMEHISRPCKTEPCKHGPDDFEQHR